MMLDAERLALSPRERGAVDLVELAKAAVADVAPLAIASGYEIGFSSNEEQLIVNGDPYAISRAMTNLLGNAITHGGNGGVIDVEVDRQGWFQVSDQGPGVPADARSRVFEPFSREGWDKDGCGLGLFLVQEVMGAHGGAVRLVQGERGATFRLEFTTPRDERRVE